MRPVKSPTHHITVSIDSISLNVVRHLAEQRDTSVSGLLRDLIREELARLKLDAL
jgi:hypothetical protein